LAITSFAQAPDLVHPIAVDVDDKGRVLVVESHTHFRPPQYQGPKADRVRILVDKDGDGKADQIETFFEGTIATMDLAIHPDGSVYLATRNEILRLVDENQDGKAERTQRIVFLETKGNYPHNGLSGLAFDARGDLYFGMGENLGEPYALQGSDGAILRGGGEGGRMFRCDRLGKGLRSVATGFWNPFGAGRDPFDRVFVVDNDPDASPPCRLLHLVPGGDYGFQFRYGRSGRHGFQSWNGELKGTLPYASGTGESPCEVVSYESDAFPAEYRGHLLVPVWADHRVERYEIQPRGASFQGIRKPFIQGGKEFRPSGLAVAGDGSVFVTDWVSQSYELHGKGALWRIQAKTPGSLPRLLDPSKAILHPDRTTREKAATSLAKTAKGKSLLKDAAQNPDSRIRATALTALAVEGDRSVDWKAIASHDPEVGVRELAVKALISLGESVDEWVDSKHPPTVRALAIDAMSEAKVEAVYPDLLCEKDPFLFHAAVHRLARSTQWLKTNSTRALADPDQRMGIVLAWGASGTPESREVVTRYLEDQNPEVRFLAIKAISDHDWKESLPQLKTLAMNDSLDVRSLMGVMTAMGRLENLPVNEDALVGRFADRLTSANSTLAGKIQAMRAIPAHHARAKNLPWNSLFRDPSPELKVETLRLIQDQGSKKEADSIQKLAQDTKQPEAVRCQAIATIGSLGVAPPSFFLAFLNESSRGIREEALRALAQIPLSAGDKKLLESSPLRNEPGTKDLVGRLLQGPKPVRPTAQDIGAWVAKFEAKGDAEAGRRIFEHPRLANCARCHAVDGRGARVGPDLSLMGNTNRRWLLESLLQPANSIAPHYQAYTIETNDGRLRAGILQRTYLDESTFIDQQGQPFTVAATDMVAMTPRKDSLMPEGLLDLLTDQEILDLLTFLETRKSAGTSDR